MPFIDGKFSRSVTQGLARRREAMEAQKAEKGQDEAFKHETPGKAKGPKVEIKAEGGKFHVAAHHADGKVSKSEHGSLHEALGHASQHLGGGGHEESMAAPHDEMAENEGADHEGAESALASLGLESEDSES